MGSLSVQALRSTESKVNYLFSLPLTVRLVVVHAG
jgi:hypothetical protein